MWRNGAAKQTSVTILFTALVFLGVFMFGGMQPASTDDGRFGNQIEYTKITLTTADVDYTISGTGLKTYWLAITSDEGSGGDAVYFKPCGADATTTDIAIEPGETLALDVNCTAWSAESEADTVVVRVYMLKRGGI